MLCFLFLNYNGQLRNRYWSVGLVSQDRLHFSKIILFFLCFLLKIWLYLKNCIVLPYWMIVLIIFSDILGKINHFSSFSYFYPSYYHLSYNSPREYPTNLSILLKSSSASSIISKNKLGSPIISLRVLVLVKHTYPFSLGR